MRSRGIGAVSASTTLVYVFGFFACTYISGRIWHSTRPHIINSEVDRRTLTSAGDLSMKLIEEVKEVKLKPISSARSILEEVASTHEAIRNLDKTISSLEMELAAARSASSLNTGQDHTKATMESVEIKVRQKAFVVIGINTAFSSKRRRDSVRETWMPQGAKLKQLESEKGIIIRFVIGHSATYGGVLDRAIDAENAKYNDFLRLEHVEGYHELSTKTKIYFSTAVAKWDAEFYVKVDDDVHVNIGSLSATLARHRSHPRVYIGCMKSGPVLAQKGLKYHEPEFWKFGEEGNKYFRHATGQIYALSKDLATYLSINQAILHKYANEDVSLGSWLIGLDVDHVDDRSLCCGTPPDCEWKAQAETVCAASFDWSCSGICKSVEKMKSVHERCAEEPGALWNSDFMSQKRNQKLSTQ